MIGDKVPKSWVDSAGTLKPHIAHVAARYARGDSILLISKQENMSVGQVSRIGHRCCKIPRYDRRERVERRMPLVEVALIPDGVVFMCICGGKSNTPIHEGCERRQGLDRRNPT